MKVAGGSERGRRRFGERKGIRNSAKNQKELKRERKALNES